MTSHPPFEIRRATAQDAPALLVYMKRLLSEPNHNMRRDADEFTATVEEEAQAIENLNNTLDGCFAVALSAGEIIGVLTCRRGEFRAERHNAELGISVDAAWRSRGVGAALMQYAVDWARGTGSVHRISLFVFVRNTGAIRLYERFGFAVEGRLRDDMYRNGEYLDTLIMGLLID